MKQKTKIFVAFLIGQAVQVVLHALCFNYWQSRQIPFVIAGGFLVAVAVMWGMQIGKG